jgi:Domain of unknown function (DUF1902)
MTIPGAIIDSFVEITAAGFDGDWGALLERVSGMVAGLIELEKRPETGIAAGSDAPIVVGAIIDRIGSPAIDNAIQATMWGMSDRPIHRALGEAWLHAHPDERSAFDQQSAHIQFEEIMKGRSLNQEAKALLPDLPPKMVHFRAFRDEDAGVWVATSDADRITTEGETKEEVIQRLTDIVPDVLDSRHGRTGKVLISIDWQELRTVDHTTLAVA